MSRKNYQEELEFAQAMGMDSTSALSAMRPGYVRAAYNCNLGLYSGYYKRNGFTSVLSSAWGSRSITGGQEYKDSTGTIRVAVHGTDGSTSRVGYTTGSSVTDILTGKDGSARPSFVATGDLLFWFNGVDAPQVIDGTNARQLGITAPAAPTLSSQTTGGSLTVTSSYVFAYTYYNSVTGAESSPSSLLSVTLTGANCKVILNVSAGSSTTADTIRVWRTVANGNTLFLDGTALISATSYTSTVADTGLGRQMDDDNSRITTFSSTTRYGTHADSRVFVVTDDNEVRWSKIGLYGPMYESFEVKAVANTADSKGANNKIVGIRAAGDIPIVLKQKSVGRLEPVGLPDSSSVTDQQIYFYKQISAEYGAISHWAACEVEGQVIYLGRDNVYATDGNSVHPIADAISATIKDFSFSSTQAALCSAGTDTKNKRVYFSCFASSSDTVPTWILVGDFQQRSESGGINWRWTIYRPGSNTTTHPGIKAGCFIPITNSSTGVQDMWFGNYVTNGQIYKMNQGTIDDDKAIYFRIISRPYSLGSPTTMKLFKTCAVQATGNGGNYNLGVGALFNLGSAEESINSFSLYSSGGLWDAATWGTDRFADEDSKDIRYSAHRKAKWMQLIIQQTEASAPVTVYGWSASGSMFGPF